MIELRSDTFTLPTPEMRRAMGEAPLGDDVYGEDPTTNRLEELAAATLGKEAACFLPSGTMANLASIMAHAPRGTKVLVGDESDIYIYEAGGASVAGGIVYEPVPTQPDGRLLLTDLAKGFPDDPDDPQFALPALICLENTHNRSGGSVLPLDYLADVRRFADERGVPVHLDGARLFNAAVGAGVPVADIARYADSVQFCLSKGLSAPIGSLAVGTADFVGRVRRIRKLLGGGMRQTGVIAAAGILAIENAGRLAEDHRNAERLAAGLAGLEGIDVLPAEHRTNIVMFRVTDPRFTWQTFAEAASQHGLAVAELGHGRLRAVTHRGVGEKDIDEAIEVVARVLASVPVEAGAGHRA
ncbi:GntG family PLP-dependent aldolase [Streptomyces acidiscabies]|uniref:GntG family PLP-dependent aldolase n=1 Tax=Streptomyces acidiscabies TaxID=42234 RepID=A0AAP6B4Y5_9ACTN|nr:GntG family PLP-dependent aldolase [Streptomyces acidiscabies]MBP5941317.1 threonine aldolase [Streptomyces sp. LBUM 1476]MBZ3912667.1 threonine aldolase [Streptomyces acidiscabies]MDX2958150.1 GntG family PLP-dependent aldolase [Streptomyces acidiscabies]MDX3018517.1 GntG family PLP-dependent aldolase [Streptomyces acidiscabies]MDX3791180.1 GntG family PLP-dependent aldolase [Streptomyces acidiscabies]